mmetsp:Transcript_37334/g.84321  ORF Transcript_37334/g.84321 Transcript_37334/m.84321 type:complete len:139 (+) Transcript_37334:62-478(+)
MGTCCSNARENKGWKRASGEGAAAAKSVAQVYEEAERADEDTVEESDAVDGTRGRLRRSSTRRSIPDAPERLSVTELRVFFESGAQWGEEEEEVHDEIAGTDVASVREASAGEAESRLLARVVVREIFAKMATVRTGG